MGAAMENEDVGEHSKKGRTVEGDGNRPFKKARYVWQLKGKYHLKKSNAKASVDSASEVRKICESSDTDSDSEVNCLNNNIAGLGSDVCNGRCCIDDLLAKSDALLETANTAEGILRKNIEKSISDEIPITLVKPCRNKYDDYMYDWQARQVAKSFVDNTINSILEHWKLAPFDAADFVENCENGEQVEDEGIMMAIQSHGLQSNIRQCAPNLNRSETSRYECHSPTADILGKNTTTDRLKGTHKEQSADQLQDPMDFLNAAVSAAIQKKGLSSHNNG